MQRSAHTPLYGASAIGNVDIVHMLLDARAIIDARDYDGYTPLWRGIQGKHVDVARMLLDWGAKISNVKLDSYLPVIPDWVIVFIESRSNCRTASTIVIAIHKYHRTNITAGHNDMNVLRLISKHIWSTRMDDKWTGK
jgi:hypothetical protein